MSVCERERERVRESEREREREGEREREILGRCECGAVILVHPT